MAKIKEVKAREILDSRGHPTVEVEVVLDDGSKGTASVPSGASTGVHEALELRDGDQDRYGGKGVLRAVGNVESEIKNALVGLEASDLRAIDGKMIELDGTANKGRLGANAILGTSLATARAQAHSEGLPLYQFLRNVYNPDLGEEYVMPVPMMNILNGGKHADSNIDFQEFEFFPLDAVSFPEAIRMGSEVFHKLGEIMEKNDLSTNVGNEGGYAADFTSHEHALKIVFQAVDEAGYRPGEQAYLGFDIAASSFFKEGKYNVSLEKKVMDSAELTDFLKKLMEDYPIVSIEDPLDEDDWDGWKVFTENFGETVQIVGDDLFVTNVERIKKGIDQRIANAILIKPNQIGSLSETVDAILMGQKAGYGIIVSHRSGETEDTFIADLVVALNCGQIKTGSMSRSERMSKYNRLLQINDELGDRAKYLGKKTFSFLQ